MPVSHWDNDEDNLEGEELLDMEEREDYKDASENAAEDSALPWRTLSLLYVIVCFDVSVLMVIIPFLPAFCEEKLGLSGVKLGTAVGLITSSYYLSNSISSAWMGHLSDIYGRRPVLFFGLATGITTVSLFPFSTALWMAVLNRVVCGFFNSNITITKSCLADISGKWGREKRAATFGYLGAAWGLSRFFSSAFAGVTTGIKLKFLPIAGDNPYFFPCAGVSGLLLLVAIFAYFRLPETRNSDLIALHNAGSEDTQNAAGRSMLKRLGYLNERGGPVLIRVIIVHMLHQFINGGALTILVLFWALDENKGGYGLDSNQVGILFAFYGLIGLVFQLLCFRTASRKYGLRRLYNFGASLLSTGAIILWSAARLVLLTPSKPLRFTIMLLSSAPLSVGFMCGLPVLTGLLSNASPPQIMGLSQGTAQSTGALCRMMGPIFFGTLFSFCVERGQNFVPFVGVSLLYIVALFITISLPESLEYPFEDAAEIEVRDRKEVVSVHGVQIQVAR
mmetsp:Transcript_796/g.2566  ORF Transcript_796/g.2566 Transcript_796/m.2566 type:complete len:506 (+) Transcript_796:136-1653(+)|eukprot:CAMPEP_0198725312 /NCGR_PEP_ID=MMETSP1475-20131203/2640_1 /TAXON_ID= ORGANISM="Unidentified sp., Strain CCMP1999" /NCGR_SAMPLE_ID=MMETSP1475 /ASSEMBLY_ACC=CAM_ASM_001111 /LENGTH=505 /DNA_ID=CAMNT_0044487061 /DNA_START=51 /DNA_END=1568 /DNA_ORIENTATION=+